MQFKVLVPFFFAYIAAIQATPIDIPKLPTDAVVGGVNLPVDIPVNIPIDVRSLDGPLSGDVVAEILDKVSRLSVNDLTTLLSTLSVANLSRVLNILPEEVLAVLPPGLLSKIPVEELPAVNLPIGDLVRRDVADVVGVVGQPLKTIKDIAASVIPLDVHNTLPLHSLGKRADGVLSGLEMPIKGALTPLVDGATYAVHTIAKSGVEKVLRRQLGDGLPTVPSTEGVAPELKVLDVPTIPNLPLKTRKVDLPDVDVLKVEGITNKVTTPKIVRRYLRRQNSGCADAPSRRSLDDIKVPDVPALRAVEVPSTPSLPIN